MPTLRQSLVVERKEGSDSHASLWIHSTYFQWVEARHMAKLANTRRWEYNEFFHLGILYIM